MSERSDFPDPAVDVAAEQVKITLLRSDRTTLPHLHLKADSNGVAGDDPETLTITAGIRLQSWAGKAVIEEPAGVNPQRPRMDHALISAVARAHRWKESLLRGNAQSLDDIAKQDGCTSQYVRQLLKLAFLAPEFVEAILTGRQPIGLRLTTLAQKALPLSWCVQRDTFAWDVKPA